MADEASLALVGAFLELEDFKSVVKLAARFAKLYPKSTFLDSFQYSEALANFHLGQYDRAIEVAQTIARADLQRRGRRRPAQPEQVAGPLYSGPDLRRPPSAGQGARILSPGGRPVQRRRRRDPVLHPQGAEGARGLGHPPGESARRGRRSRSREASASSTWSAARSSTGAGDQARNRSSTTAISPRSMSRSTPST